MGKKKNPAAVALGKLAASKRSKADFAEAGRRGMASRWGNRKAQQNGAGPTSAALAESSTVAETGAQKAKDLAIQRNYAARDGADQRNYERDMRRQEKRLKKANKV
jgi:hypothetical protein